MSTQLIQQAIIDLLKEAGQAHHQAFLATDGADPEWPIWYADYLHKTLGELINAAFAKSELTYLLVKLDKEIQLIAPGHQSWPSYYAKRIIEWYG
ncbi:hypothetical protein [Candidatus Leptofilum sp.]|uniref:hypothetical protein n=1 Tax=Candidatus Leptofilum sp. TaxID=3241576 RepID=UPI003B5B20A4